MDDNGLEVIDVGFIGLAVLTELLEFFVLFFILGKLLQILDSYGLPEFDTFFGEWFDIQLQREQTFGMDLGIPVEIKVNNSLQMQEQEVWQIPQHTPLGKIAFHSAHLTHVVIDDISFMHSFQCQFQCRFLPHSNRVAEILLLPFSFVLTVVADHLHNGGALEQLPKKSSIRSSLQFVFKFVEIEVKELSSVLLNVGIDRLPE